MKSNESFISDSKGISNLISNGNILLVIITYLQAQESGNHKAGHVKIFFYRTGGEKNTLESLVFCYFFLLFSQLEI